MYVVADLCGQNTEVLRSFLISGNGSDIVQGQLVMEGPASAPDYLGAVITATSAAVNVTGLLTQLHDYSVAGDWTYDGTLTTATNRPEADVDIRPFAVIRGEVAICGTQTLTVSAASTDVTLNTDVGADDLLGGGWVYNPTANEVRFIEDHDATAGIVFNTAATTAYSADACHIVPSRLYGSSANQGLTPTAGTLICEGNETVLWAKTLDHYITYDGKNEPTRLNPGIHDGLDTLSGVKVHLDIVIMDHSFNSLS